MKHAWFLRGGALTLALCLCLCSCGSGDEPVESAPAPLSSALPASSEEEEATSSEDKLPEYDENGWAIVENIRLNLGLGVMDDHTRCFPEDAKGYVVEGSPRPYQLDDEALRRVAASPCKGSGSLLWRDFRNYAANNPDQFDGVIPVSKLNDPIYLSMNLPSEALTIMTSRVNAQNMAYYPENANRVLPIGAVYPNHQIEIDNGEVFTVCLGRINLALKTKDRDWYLADDHVFPTSPDRLYYLPWELESKLGVRTLSADRINRLTDHVEVTLTGADLNGGDKRSAGATAACLHFWGAFVNVNGPDAQGVVSSYVAWIKEEEGVGKLVATIAADWYSPEGSTMQAFAGYNYVLKTEPRTLVGHTVGPKAYDEVMDTETVQSLIGLK